MLLEQSCSIYEDNFSSSSWLWALDITLSFQPPCGFWQSSSSQASKIWGWMYSRFWTFTFWFLVTPSILSFLATWPVAPSKHYLVGETQRGTKCHKISEVHNYIYTLKVSWCAAKSPLYTQNSSLAQKQSTRHLDNKAHHSQEWLHGVWINMWPRH